VVGIFSFNTVRPIHALEYEDNRRELIVCSQIDYLQIPYAIHRLSGICSPANAAYSVAELTHQLKTSSVKVLFTCVPLLQTALKAADAANVPRENIFILPMAFGGSSGSGITIDDLVAEGDALPELDALRWNRGQGARQPAFLCYSSGTSGLPVWIAQRNVMSWVESDCV
jgi:acyl-CoA synthetase (AMP-forming)/AMP-acid ligase II